jgi:taurine--2-oxoglutarate transaminase
MPPVPSSDAALHRATGERVFFTWSVQSQARPFEIVQAEGARFQLADGRWIWDLESQTYNVNVGHVQAHVVERMIAQLHTLPAAAPNVLLPIRRELGEALAQVSGMAKFFFATGGSEAVENAIKLARLVTGRRTVLARRRSYHGATQAVLEIAGDARRAPFAAADGAWIDDPYPPRAPTPERPSDWVEAFDAALARAGAHTVAAVLLEGLTGTNGVQVPPPDFWPHVRARCSEHGIVLIDDEIFSGFGRTGRWFAKDHWGVEPDILVMGKGLTSGYAPLAAVGVSPAIARHFDDAMLWCGLTTYAQPVACAAAMGCIEVLQQQQLVERAAVSGARLAAGLRALQATPGLEGVIRDVRGLGLHLAVELDRPSKPWAEAAWERGAYLPTRERLAFVCPPLCLHDAEADAVVAVLGAALRAVVAADAAGATHDAPGGTEPAGPR